MAQRLTDYVGLTGYLDRAILTHRHPVGELTPEQVADGLTLLRPQSGDVHAVADTRMVAQLCQHHPSTRVPDKYDTIVDAVEDGCDGLDVGAQVAEAARRRTRAG